MIVAGRPSVPRPALTPGANRGQRAIRWRAEVGGRAMGDGAGRGGRGGRFVRVEMNCMDADQPGPSRLEAQGRAGGRP